MPTFENNDDDDADNDDDDDHDADDDVDDDDDDDVVLYMNPCCVLVFKIFLIRRWSYIWNITSYHWLMTSAAIDRKRLLVATFPLDLSPFHV